MNTLQLMSNDDPKHWDQAERASRMLRGKMVARVIRHRPTSVYWNKPMEHNFLWIPRPKVWNFQLLAEGEDEFASLHHIFVDLTNSSEIK